MEEVNSAPTLTIAPFRKRLDSQPGIVMSIPGPAAAKATTAASDGGTRAALRTHPLYFSR